MSTKSPITWIMAISVMMLTGCVTTGTAWKRDDATADQFAADKAACRRYAHREAEDAYSDRAGLSGAGGVNNYVQYNALMQRHDARRDARIQFERCLMRRGYRKMGPNAASKNM